MGSYFRGGNPGAWHGCRRAVVILGASGGCVSSHDIIAVEKMLERQLAQRQSEVADPCHGHIVASPRVVRRDGEREIVHDVLLRVRP